MRFFSQKRIYLDYASATPVDPHALHAVSDAMRTIGNPSSIHREGVQAQQLLDSARERIARLFEVKSRELIFTSGGTEGNNLAILGFARSLTAQRGTLQGTHWIVSALEHPSVLECFSEIERLGGSVSHVDSDEKGIIRPQSVANLLKPETVFASVGWANGETGVIQPLSDIARAIAAHEATHRSTVIFHADAGQAPLYLPSTIHSLDVDMLTLDSAKLYGPRGVGALYLSNRVQLASIMRGGSQERGLRPGTENVALAAGFAEALVQAAGVRIGETKRLRVLRDQLASMLMNASPEMLINGDLDRALPNMLNVSLPGIQSEYFTLALDHAGVAISTKTACKEGRDRRSSVVEPLGGPQWRAENTLRFSLGRETTYREIARASKIFSDLMHKGDPALPEYRG